MRFISWKAPVDHEREVSRNNKRLDSNYLLDAFAPYLIKVGWIRQVEFCFCFQSDGYARRRGETG